MNAKTLSALRGLMVGAAVVSMATSGCGGDDEGSGAYGNYDFDLYISSGFVRCQDGQWTGTVTDRGAEDGAPTRSVTVLSWSVGAGKPAVVAELTERGEDGTFEVALDAAEIGVSCEAVDTALLFLPRGKGTFGDPDGGSVGAMRGGGYNGFDGAQVDAMTEGDVASVTAQYYDLAADDLGKTYELSQEGGEPGKWSAPAGELGEGVMIGFVARDADGNVIGVMAL